MNTEGDTGMRTTHGNTLLHVNMEYITHARHVTKILLSYSCQLPEGQAEDHMQYSVNICRLCHVVVPVCALYPLPAGCI